jgi:uncharacterized protein (DUF1697 family)
MYKYIVLLRGVNVGGNNLLPMKELSALLQTNGFVDVSTYIQSGNIVLKSRSNPVSKIRTLVTKKFGFEPKVLALRVAQFMQAVLIILLDRLKAKRCTSIFAPGL